MGLRTLTTTARSMRSHSHILCRKVTSQNVFFQVVFSGGSLGYNTNVRGVDFCNPRESVKWTEIKRKTGQGVISEARMEGLKKKDASQQSRMNLYEL